MWRLLRNDRSGRRRFFNQRSGATGRARMSGIRARSSSTYNDSQATWLLARSTGPLAFCVPLITEMV